MIVFLSLCLLCTKRAPLYLRAAVHIVWTLFLVIYPIALQMFHLLLLLILPRNKQQYKYDTSSLQMDIGGQISWIGGHLVGSTWMGCTHKYLVSFLPWWPQEYQWEGVVCHWEGALGGLGLRKGNVHSCGHLYVCRPWYIHVTLIAQHARQVWYVTELHFWARQLLQDQLTGAQGD